MKSLAWVIPAIIALLAIAFAIILPAYTLLLAGITILRSKWRTRGLHDDDGSRRRRMALSPWNHIATTFFQGKVFHVRHRPMVHSFSYPLYFSVVDLDEASELFGAENVRPQPEQRRRPADARGSLWPLSSLMRLRDVDHLKNGEGSHAGESKELRTMSMRERISNLVRERTGGKLDLGSDRRPASERRKILLVTHLMYYGYCFNPVSLYFVLKPKANDGTGDGAEEIEAMVVEVSNTPWNEMSIYVLHPDSVDTVECHVYPSNSPDSASKTYRYKWRKNFHVSPFMTMDHDYDWKFRVSGDRIKVEAKMIRRDESEPSGEGGGTPNGANKEKGLLYFTAGFDIRRKIQPTSAYPLHLARVIFRFPIYCFVIQLWIHYEAVRLLIKGVEFIPHPGGSETGASRAIGAATRPVFAAMDAAEAWWRRGKDGGKSKIV